MDAPQWPQGVGVGVGVGVVRRVDETESSRSNSEKIKKARVEKEEAAALNCPRCNSSNTKFCYYNNYSRSQPRYFCKSCRRYWTAGGTLRNVPVGGTSRKRNKRLSSSSSNSYPSISTQKWIPDLSPQKISPQTPKIHQGRDLNLPYKDPPLYNEISHELVALPFTLDPQNPSFDIFKTGGLSSLVSGPVSDSTSVISSGFQLGENRYGNLQAAVEDESSRIIFPSEEANYEFEHDRGMQRDSNGCWSGMNMMLSGGSW